jgi:hypothetical protein
MGVGVGRFVALEYCLGRREFSSGRKTAPPKDPAANLRATIQRILARADDTAVEHPGVLPRQRVH